jgi:hypothetical protein
MSHPSRVLLAVGIALLAACRADAQQVTVQTPLQNNSATFFEQSSVGWSMNGPGFFARFGNPGLSRPPFGGFVPNAGLTTGFAINGGGFNTNFNFDFSQGSSYSSVTQAPVITLTNGVPGFLIAGQQRNFVTGLVPVVGNGGGFFYVPSTSWQPAGYFNGFNPGYGPALMPTAPASPIAGRLQNGEFTMQNGRVVAPGDRGNEAESRDNLPPPLPRDLARPSVTSATAVRQQQIERKAAELAVSGRSATDRSKAGTAPRSDAASNRETARRYLDRARQAESSGQPSTALIYYRLAAKHADAALQSEVDAALLRLESR